MRPVELSAKTYQERILYGFNFSRLLRSGETLSSATFSMAVSTGTDPSPASMLEGAAVVDFSPIVRQMVVGGAPGTEYFFGVSVETSLGQRFEESVKLKVTL